MKYVSVYQMLLCFTTQTKVYALLQTLSNV